MSQVLDILKGFNGCDSYLGGFRPNTFTILRHRRTSSREMFSSTAFKEFCGVQFSSPAVHGSQTTICFKAQACNGAELHKLPHIQTLRKFPKEKLFEKVVMVRFDSKLIFDELQEWQFLSAIALSTIQYLYKAGAKVVLLSRWDRESNLGILTSEYIAESLSSILGLKVVPKFLSGRMLPDMEAWEESHILLLENLFHFEGELANCRSFSKQLSRGVDIFVNDDFSQSHKALASTVGVARFCSACIAGFYFEEVLCQLKKIAEARDQSYLAIIGGGNLQKKAAALRSLASLCDSLVFVGNMAFQIMHALGLPVPMNLVEHGATKDSLALVEFMKARNISVVLPSDFLCNNSHDPEKLDLVSVDCLLDDWEPFDLGPKTLEEITLLLPRFQKILWIGPVKFGLSSKDSGGAFKLAAVLDKQRNSDIIVVGKMACGAISENYSPETFNLIENASIVWEVFSGRNLPGLMALDRAFPFEIDWGVIYADPTRPLVVDVGSGNGLFLFRMARMRNDLNFLGLEINEKLVNRCLASVSQSSINNGHFIQANATSTFRSIVSSYPGKLVLVSIQCPNPDFNKPEHRWRMLQRQLVEAITDLLACDGKVFLQSDIEDVAIRMKNEFIRYGKGKLVVIKDLEDAQVHQEEWLRENPFGVQSDWEEHVLDRGCPMYRLLLSKLKSIA